MDVLTVGGATIDALLQIEKARDVIHLNRESKQLEIKSGEKIEVDSCTFSLGGNACNVAVGLSRLGFATGLCAEIGTDVFAQKIINGLRDERVNSSFLIQTPGAASSFAIALNVESERTLFVEHVSRSHDFNLSNLSTQWMYVTSIGDSWQHAYRYIAQIASHKKIQVAYSPGTHQLDTYYEEVNMFFSLTQMLCVNKEEAARIARFYAQKEETDIANLLQILQSLGPKIISITDGARGAYAVDKEGAMWHIDQFPQTVVERTGAGDAYATGFVAALMEEKTVSDAMRYGSLNAASVIGAIGAQKGLLTKEEMEERIAQHIEFAAKNI